MRRTDYRTDASYPAGGGVTLILLGVSVTDTDRMAKDRHLITHHSHHDVFPIVIVLDEQALCIHYYYYYYHHPLL